MGATLLREKFGAKLDNTYQNYEVNGEKYETLNRILETGAELPVGTKVYVWYKKDNPNQAILGTELESYSFKKILGFLLVAIGINYCFYTICFIVCVIFAENHSSQ